jgi:peptide/nickel transport system permease protein
MFRYIIRRLIFSIPVLLISSILVFVAVRATSNPVASLALNPRVSQADRIRLAHQLGLDKSGWQQYTAWLSHFVKGDWGKSLITNRSVSKDIREALVNSAVLGFVGVLFSLIVGVAIGVYSALKQYSAFDTIATGGAFFGLSIPNFWFALILQIFFGLYLTKWFHLSTPIFYTAGMTQPGTTGFHVIDRLRHLALPALVLSVQIIAIYSRYMRASMLEVMHSDYLRTARAKGLRERRVIVRHAMRNALIPLTTQVAIDVGAIAGGLIITEQIFQWPGMGRFFITAIGQGDYPQVLPWLMVTVAFVILFNLVADILYAVLDPRIRYA